MQSIKLNISIILSFTLFLMFSANISFAQEDANNSFLGLEEIIVTAQKREQNINEVGMSIDVASGDQLENAGVKDMIDLGRLVSGFTANSNYYGTYTYTGENNNKYTYTCACTRQRGRRPRRRRCRPSWSPRRGRGRAQSRGRRPSGTMHRVKKVHHGKCKM